MPLSLAFWAKLGNETWPEKYHPVVCHLIDVAAVARQLWDQDQVYRPKVREWVTDRLGLPDPDTAGAWLSFWAGAHDIGKAAPDFQLRGKTAKLRERLEADTFDLAHAGCPMAHGPVGTAVLATELYQTQTWPSVDEAVARAVAVAVGGHHGLFPTNWHDRSGPLGNHCWAEVRRQMLTDLARFYGVIGRPAPRWPARDDQSVWMFVAGLTSVADWIGSNQVFFPPKGNPDVANGSFDLGNHFRDADTQAQTALTAMGWLNRPKQTGRRYFVELFREIVKEKPRPLQIAVEKIAGDLYGPSLVLIEAPMGEGKTEAAWYLHHAWEQDNGQGCYVALPTMATSNQMYDRVVGFLKAEGGEGEKNLMLLHGKAALNETFQNILKKDETSSEEPFEIYDDDGAPSGATAEAWFAANKKHGLLAPYGVGTIDQVLLAVLQTRHVFVRLLGLAGKCVILDEVHAYDAYMTTLMERLLRWLAALGCPVVLLSATLPRTKRLELLRAYAGNATAEPNEEEYPRITTVTVRGEPKACHVEAHPDRAREVKLDWMKEEGLPDQLRQSLAAGGCAVVIRNTVGLAQKTYSELRGALEGANISVELLHARFPFGRRAEIEDAVKSRFGPDGRSEGRDRRVLVATQIVEQSLDLDFDLMLTDVAPVDLVLQRAGRLHRHERGLRPPGVNEPRLVLIAPGEKDGLPDFGDSERWIYERFVLLRSYLALTGTGDGVVHLPDDLEVLVEQVYGDGGLDVPDSWGNDLNAAQRKMEVKKIAKRQKAAGIAIFGPDEGPLEQQMLSLEEDDPEAAKRIQAQTRDADPDIRLIVIYQIDGRDFLDAAGQEPFSEKDRPNLERVRRLLRNEVSLSHGGCVAHYVARPVPKGWQKHGLLRHHRIVRVDSRGVSLTKKGEYKIFVDNDLGVVY